MPATTPRAYQITDIDWKQAVRALSDTNINLVSPGALVIDAVVLNPYDRVLLTAQTDATENGIYQVNAAQTLLVPAPDWINNDYGVSAAVNSGLTVTVTQGAVYAQTNWTLTNPNPIVIGTTAIVFEQVPEASDRIGNIFFDNTVIEIANAAPETDISILPSGAGTDVGIVIPNEATANVDDLHIFNSVTNGNVKISTAGGDWSFYGNNSFGGTGTVFASNFIGNASQITGISKISNGTSQVDIATANGDVNLAAGSENWTFDTAGNTTVPGSIVGVTTGNTGSMHWEVNGGGYNVMKLIPDDTLVSLDRYIVIDPYTSGHIHIRAGGPQDNSQAYLLLGGDDVHVEVDDITKEVRVKTYDTANSGAYQFSFENDGHFLAPVALRAPRVFVTQSVEAQPGGSTPSITGFLDGDFSGNVTAGYFIGNGSQLTGLPASYGNANVANYLPTYTGNVGAGNVNFVNGSTIKTAVNNINMNANTGGAVEITTDGGNYTWSFDNYGWTYLPQAQAAYTPVVNGSVLFGSEALVFKAGYANLIFDNTGNTTTGNYFLGNVQGLVGTITNLDSLNFSVENISALVANNGVNIGAGGFNNLLVLPTDVLIQNVPLSVAANIIGVTADNDGRIEWIGNSSGDGGGYTTLTLTPDETVNGQVLVLDPTAPGHIHLRAPGIGGNVEQPAANIFLGAENTNFEITAQYVDGAEARIHSAGNTWTFSNSGDLTVPNYVKFAGNTFIGDEPGFGSPAFRIVAPLTYGATIETDSDISGNSWTWTFGADGVLGAPGNITAGYFIGDGSQLTGLPAGYTDADVATFLAAFGSNTINTTGNITAGNFIGSGSNIEIAAQTAEWIFDTTGNLTLPGNTFAVNYANGTAVSLGGGSYGNADVSNFLANGFGSNTISTTGNITGGNLITTGILSATGNITGNTAGYTIGYRDIPQVTFSANATAALTDAGKHFYSTTAGNLALTLPDNVSVAFPTGATLTIVVNAAGNVLVNQGTGVTLYQAGASTTGNRVVGAYGLASVMKVAANTWVISGTGVY